MGIDLHAVNFLKRISKHGPFGKVATLGRQGLHVPEPKLRQLGYSRGFDEYCEKFLIENFGATQVDSFDNSDFEHATYIMDLNQPTEIRDQYDTIIDCGTMEHVFNAPQGLANVAQMCRNGGQIVHVLPANNLCNHGFWQFSPELFFSLYSSKNGYAETEVFLADVGEDEFWYQVTPPSNGHWGDALSERSLYCLVRTRKIGATSQADVQQSQYVNDWQTGGAQEHQAKTKSSRDRLKDAIRGTPLFPIMRIANRLIKDPNGALKKNPNFRRVMVTADDRHDLRR